MTTNKRSTAPGFFGIAGRVVRWWNSLPPKQLTRRGLMELSDEQLMELGLPRRKPFGAQLMQPRRNSDRRNSNG